MHLTVPRAALKAALDFAARVVERRNTIPILGNVHLQAAPSTLSLTATNLDVTVTIEIEAAVGAGGTTTVPAHMLRDIVAKLADGAEVAITAPPEGRAQIRAGRARFELSQLPSADFPALSLWQPAATWHMTGTALAGLLAPVRFAVSTEETRYYLNGVYLHAVDAPAGPMLTAVATDGHRLSLARLPLPEGAGAMPGIIVPRQTVDEIIRLAEAAGDDLVDLAVSDARVSAARAAGRVRLDSKLIDGTFPDYVRVIPQSHKTAAAVDRPLLAAVVDRVAAVATARGAGVRLTFSDGAEAGELAVSMVAAQTGEAHETLGVDLDGPPVELAANSRYLLDLLGALATGTVRLRLGNAGTPILIEPIAPRSDAPGQQIVLMPIRV